MFFGLSGKASVGKDTVADFLISDFGFDKKIAFSDNLKKACTVIFDLSHWQVSTQEGKKTPLERSIIVSDAIINDIMWWMSRTHTVDINSRNYRRLIGKKLTTPREVLQFVGTDVMRYYIPSYHIDIVRDKIEQGGNIIITDVRFPNEAELILSLGGFLVRIERPSHLRLYRGDGRASHVSETMLDSWDRWSYFLPNTSDNLSVLKAQVKLMLSDLRAAPDGE